MHCYLHIGVEKTGTTSIQKFYLNRALLNQNGYQLTDSQNQITGITVLSLSSLKNEEQYFSVVSSEEELIKKAVP